MNGQGYLGFPSNPWTVPDFRNFLHPAMRLGVGVQLPPVMGWYPHPPPLPLPHPSHLGLHAPLHQVKEEDPCDVDKVKEKDEGKARQGPHSVLPVGQYPSPYRMGGASISNHPQQSFFVPNTGAYPTASKCSPQTPQEPAAPNMEGSRCDSDTPTDHTRSTESNSPIDLTMNREEIRDEEQVPGDEKVPTTTEMKEFAKLFRKKRMDLNFTQEEVGHSLAILYGMMAPPWVIHLFECCQLTFASMCVLKPLLEKWMVDAEKIPGLKRMIHTNFCSCCERSGRKATVQPQAGASLWPRGYMPMLPPLPMGYLPAFNPWYNQFPYGYLSETRLRF